MRFTGAHGRRSIILDKHAGIRLYGRLVSTLRDRCLCSGATLTEPSTALDHPSMWWNKVLQEDREELRVFRELGEFDESLETLEHVRDVWVRDKKGTRFDESDLHEIVPMWVAVHQGQPFDTAKLHVTKLPMAFNIPAELVYKQQSQATIRGCNFSLCDTREGDWHNFFIGVRGVIGGEEHEVLWPNWVYHDNRCMTLCRGWKDVLTFLADPTKEAILQHLENVKRMQQDRGYHEGWCLHRLMSRWGSAPLVKYEIDV